MAGNVQGPYELTLCWSCDNTNRHKCSWFNPNDPQPVPGWVAERQVKSRIGETFTVKECPNYAPMAPREPVYTGPTIPGVVRRGTSWVAFINSKKKKYHLGSFATYEEAVAARKAAEAALARGEEPQSQHKGPGKPNTHNGVYLHHGRWEVFVPYKGRRRYVGRFDTEEEAVAARMAAEGAIKRGEEPRKNI